MVERVLEYSAALRRRWLYLAIGAFSLLLLGFIYGWSILAVPLQEEFAWTSAQLAVVWTTSMAMFCVGGLVGSQITRRISPQVTVLIAAFLLTGGYLVSASVTAEGLGVLTAAYGASVGGSTGMAHNAFLSSVNRWFPDKVGTSSGLLTLGFGLGSLVIGMVAGMGISALGWRWSFRAIGAATALVMVAASFFVRIPAPGQPLPPPASAAGRRPRTSPAEPSRPPSASSVGLRRVHRRLPFLPFRAHKDGPGEAWGGGAWGGEEVEERDYTTRQMLRTKVFYLTFFWSIMVAATYLSVMGNAKQIALEVGAAMHLATFMVGFISLFDGVGRLGSGLFFDRFGYRLSLIGISVAYVVASLLLFVATGMRAVPLVFCGYMFVGLGFGSISTVLAAVTNRFYGQRNYASNLAVAYMDFVPAALVGPPLIGLIETMGGSYRYGFLLLAAFAVAAVVAAFLIRPPRTG
ncbi:MAG: MFS transporter [Coriobacteriales bacterium]|nr:MFS transporter [Coriobacteriales bacterium]